MKIHFFLFRIKSYFFYFQFKCDCGPLLRFAMSASIRNVGILSPNPLRWYFTDLLRIFKKKKKSYSWYLFINYKCWGFCLFSEFRFKIFVLMHHEYLCTYVIVVLKHLILLRLSCLIVHFPLPTVNRKVSVSCSQVRSVFFSSLCSHFCLLLW